MPRFPYPEVPDGWHMVALARDADPEGRLATRLFGEPTRLEIRDGAVSGSTTLPLALCRGVVFTWSHAAGAAPQWPAPDVPELGSSDWTPLRSHHFRIRTHPQEIGENTVDVAHLPSLHGMGSANSRVEIETRDHELRVSMRLLARSRDGNEIETRSEAHNIGPGWSTVRMTSATGAESIAVYAYTPCGDEHVDYWILGTVRRRGNDTIDEKVAASSHAYQIATVAQDIPIWENKIYREAPLLGESESAIAEYRRWFRQFYSRPGRTGEGSGSPG